jgi:hypothetical protein
MEKISSINSILLAMMFVLAYFANLSTKRNKRQWLYVGFVIAAICYLVLSGIYSSYQDSASKNWLISYNLFCGVGLVLPQLISRIIVRQNIKHPVIFFKKDKLPRSRVVTGIIFAVLFLAYLAWVALSPKIMSFTDHKPVYDEFYVFSSFSFLLFYIPFVILLIEIMTMRTAFCENGLYILGVISEWSDFKSYTWVQGKTFDDPELQPFIDKSIKIKLLLESNKSLFKKPIQLLIPFDEKSAIENFLSKRVSFKAYAQQ